MSTEHSESSKIDHLSFLPPELLSTIFDLAHDPEQPLTEPLSRSLLPFFRQNLYRQIRISSFSSLSKLVETVISNPSLAILVVSLDTSGICKEGKSHQPLQRLLRHLPSLRSLTIHHLETFAPTYDDLPQLATNLETISISCTDLSSSDIDILSRLHALKSVAISFLYFSNGSALLQAGSPSKPFLDVKKLSITSLHEDSVWVEFWASHLARFVDNFFPRISQLCLMDYYHPDYCNLLGALTTVSATIESLVLQSGGPGEVDFNSCQHLFPRFKRLKHLELGEGTVSTPLAEHLQQLPSLRTLRLAPYTDSDGLTLADLLAAIDGPSRTASLQVLVVDSINKMKIGRQVDSDADEASLTSLEKDGWLVPRRVRWNLEDLEPLLEAGRRNGIEVKGLSFEALRVWKMANLEEANRIILRAYHSKSWKEYIAERAFWDRNPRLPNLDVDRLDPENLKLVKIDLPEEDWFQFTLE